MRLRRLGFLCAVVAVVLSGCNSGNDIISTTTPTTGLRYLNGSPDLGTVDVYINKASGTPNAGAIAYGALAAYADIPSKAYTVIVTATGVPSSTKLTCALPSLAANTRYTLVIAGKVAGGTSATGLQCQLFAETVYSLPANQFQLAFHHASPAANAASLSTVSFGLYSAGTTNYQLPSGTATFVSTLTSGTADGVATNVLVQAVSTAPGLGVYTSTQTGVAPTTVLATTTPSQATTGLSTATGAANYMNFMPYTTTSLSTGAVTTVSSVLSVYMIDSTTNASGVALVCAMD
jgi:hypothetical protein